MLVLVMQHGFPYGGNNIWHAAEGVFPTYESLVQLREAGGSSRELVDNLQAILAWQLDKKSWDFVTQVAKLLGPQGFKTPLFLRDDLRSRGICARTVIRVAQTPKMLTGWFSNPRLRLDFRERALSALGMKEPAPRYCKAIVVLRDPPQGIANPDVVYEQLRPYFAAWGWGLTVWRPSEWRRAHGDTPITFRDQVSMFHDAALSIMVHGAENTNLVWMPEGAQNVIVVKCGDTGELTAGMTRRMDFASRRAYPANCTIPLPPDGKGHPSYVINEGSLYYMDVERDLLPALADAMAELEATGGACRAKRP